MHPAPVSATALVLLSLLFLEPAPAASSKKTKEEFARATRELKASDLKEKALKAGVQVPEHQFGKVGLRSLYEKKPLVLKFYRGHWCPYCQRELKAYERHKKAFSKLGYKLVFVTPDLPKFITRVKRQQKLTLSIYSDKDNALAKKLGIAFKLDPVVSKLYKGFNIDLKTSQGNSKDELPMPGTYVINTSGKILYAWMDEDYKIRIPPKELLRTLKKLSAKN